MNNLKVYGFMKIVYLDENKLEFKYKRKTLIITGSNLKIRNLFDKTLEIEGIVSKIEISYIGEVND